jgi:hypothetical protein
MERAGSSNLPVSICGGLYVTDSRVRCASPHGTAPPTPLVFQAIIGLVFVCVVPP